MTSSNSRTSILIVARSFPPYARSLGSAMRMLKLAEFLINQGHEVYVLAGRGKEYSNFGYEALLERIRVVYVDDPVLRHAGESTDAQGNEAQRRKLTDWRKFLRPVVNELMIPDVGILALRRIMAAALSIVRSHGIENVLTSGPPHSDHLVGLFLKRKYGGSINWLADYRDSWNGTSLFRKSNRFLQWLNLKLESLVLKRADGVTYISDPMRAKLIAIAGSSDAFVSKLHLVMNGFDALNESLAQLYRPESGHLTVGYFGAIDDRPDSYRSPSTLFEMVIKHNLNVRFELYGTARVSPEWSAQLGKRLLIANSIPHAEALQRMAACDVLLILHTRYDGADEVVTGKVFEYLISGRPILSVGPTTMAVNRIVGDLGAGIAVPHDDHQQILNALARLTLQKSEGKLFGAHSKDLHRYSRAEQYGVLSRLLRPASAGKIGVT